MNSSRICWPEFYLFSLRIVNGEPTVTVHRNTAQKFQRNKQAGGGVYIPATIQVDGPHEHKETVLDRVPTSLAECENGELGPVVQRPDNFIQWISRYPSVSICAKISVFPLVQLNMHTLATVKFGSVPKPWTTFYVKYILDPE